MQDATLAEAFPPHVDPRFVPFGTRVLIQLRRTQTKSKGGILLVEETKTDKRFAEQIAMVHSMGSLAFRKRDTMEPWPEGQWCKPGDFVRVPRFNGDRWHVRMEDGGEPVTFVLYNDYELFGRITGDPLKMNVYLD
jgi:co-chaperonin GroES (HSP10)